MAPVQPVKALISMKGNSARVPRKNVKVLAGKPLFFWIVNQLIKARHVSDVSVETDDDEIEAISNELFPQLRVLRRPDELLGDFVSMNPLIAHHLANVEGEYFLQTHSTNPLIRAETIDGAIEAFFNDEAHDSLLSVTALHTRLYWPDGRAVNHDPSELLPTQHLPPIYEENSCVQNATCGSRRRHRIASRQEAHAVSDASDRTRQSNPRRRRQGGCGWEYVHVCIDDAARVSFTQIHPDEKAVSAVAHFKAAVTFVRRMAGRLKGRRVSSVMAGVAQTLLQGKNVSTTNFYTISKNYTASAALRSGFA
jgi:N-acylneuraminate cytidylyltransferase